MTPRQSTCSATAFGVSSLTPSASRMAAIPMRSPRRGGALVVRLSWMFLNSVLASPVQSPAMPPPSQLRAHAFFESVSADSVVASMQLRQVPFHSDSSA